jgi:glycosyltransferase involved in cell wall biosynthesis
MNEAAPLAVQEAAPGVSVVIPVRDEAGSLEPLVDAVAQTLRASSRSFEIIVVDDGSGDDSAERLAVLSLSRRWLRPIYLNRNYGQSAALQAGFDHARGEIIVTLDGDLQNDPEDVPRLLEVLDAHPAVDVVSGWRVERRDPALSRRLPSSIANRLVSSATGVPLHDYGCALKAYRAPVLKELRLYGEMHRFIPALAAEVGARVVEVPVNHRARIHGASKYGIDRTFRVLLDLIWIRFTMRFLHRPMHAFGGVGLVIGASGVAILAWLTFEKLALGRDIGTRPLLMLGVLLVLVGVQLLATGLLGEILTRIWHEPRGRAQYVLRSGPRPRAARSDDP